MKSIFQLVCEMNEAFGNPAGDPNNPDWERLSKLLPNIRAETQELSKAVTSGDYDGMRDALCDIRVFALGGIHALGALQYETQSTNARLRRVAPHNPPVEPIPWKAVPAMGLALDWLGEAIKRQNPKDLLMRLAYIDLAICRETQWLADFPADDDMRAVIAGVMTRFCQDQRQLVDTCRKYSDLGVEFTVHGEYPNVYLKSASDQGDEYPKGKFLKSVDYSQPVFAPLGEGIALS